MKENNMSKESFDLDSLMELENEFIDLNAEERDEKTKKKRKKEQVKKEIAKSGKRSFGNVMLTSVLPVVVVAPLCYFLGTMFATTVEPEVTTIKQIKSETSLKSRIDSIKDSEIQALQSQLTTLTDSYKNDEISAESITINKSINKDLVLIEQFMTEILNDDGSNDRTNIQTRIQPFFTSDELKEDEFGRYTEDQQKILDAISYSSEKSFALDNNTKTAKVGASFVSALTSGKSTSKIYQVMSPVTTSNGEIHTIMYFLKVDGVNVVSASYAGEITGLENSQRYLEEMSNIVLEERNEPEDGSIQIGSDKQLPQKESGSKKKSTTKDSDTEKSESENENESESDTQSENTSE